jgi:SAM-dependent methyltransferase
MKYSFNPEHYLAANPDAATAVENGRSVSAWGHFVQVGCPEERPGIPDPIRRVVKAVLGASLVPPSGNVLAGLPGSPDAAAYERAGKVMALDVYSAVVPFFEPDRALRILDFGCGYGAVTRFLRKAFPLSTILASDRDEGAIAWCREAYLDQVRRGHYRFIVTPSRPPLPFVHDYFDVVCGWSALAPLSEREELEWLSELKRITKPGGNLVLSSQGDALSKYFAVLKRFPSGVSGQQDLALCMKRADMVI